MAARIRASAVREQLVTAVDDWALQAATEEPVRQAWLLAVARAADPDPWRDRFRDVEVLKDRLALERLARVAKVSEMPPQFLVPLAALLLDYGVDAVPLLTAAQQRSPSDFWLNFMLGNLLQKAKRWEEAISYYRVAVALRPATVAVYNNLGNALKDKGRVDEAIAEYLKTLELDPKLAYPHFNLGSILKDKGRLDEAIAEWKKAIELGPNKAKAHRDLGAFLHKQGRFAEAKAAYREAIRLKPDSAPFHDALAWLLATCDDPKFRNYPQAIESAKRAVQLAPHEWNFWNTLGVAYRNGGQLNEAENSLRKAIRLKPDWPSAHYNLRLTLQANGQLNEAIAEFNKEIELQPKHAGNHNELAWLLATCPDPNLRDPRRAVALAKKAVELARSEGNYWNTLGVAHYRARDWKAAVQALKKSMEFRNGGDSSDCFFLAMAHWQLGDKEQTRQWYDKAVQWMDKNQPKNDKLRRFRSEAAELLEVEKKSK